MINLTAGMMGTMAAEAEKQIPAAPAQAGEELKKTAPAVTSTDGETTTTATVTGTSEEVQTLPEKAPKRSLLDKFNPLKKSPEDSQDAYTTPESAPASAEAVTETLYKQLNEVKKDEYYIVRVKKRSLLVSLGSLIFIMWLLVGGKYLIESKAPRLAFWNTALLQEIQTETAPEPSPGPAVKIRVRNNQNATSAAQMVVARLAEHGFLNAEIVDDPESEYTGVMIVTKNENLELQSLLESALADLYELSSPSAELTQDSDFDAVILLGKGVVTRLEAAQPSTPPVVPTLIPTNDAASLSAQLE